MAGVGGGERLPVARGAGSMAPFVGGGGLGHGTAVADVVALGGVGAAPLGGGGGGRVLVARGAGSVAPCLGGEEWGHGRAVAALVATGGAEAAGSGVLGSCGGVSGSASRACLSDHHELSKIAAKKKRFGTSLDPFLVTNPQPQYGVQVQVCTQCLLWFCLCNVIMAYYSWLVVL